MKGVNTKLRIKALVFDAYGTLFDTSSVVSVCNELLPGHGEELNQIWRAKQLEYTWLRSLMERYEDFWKEIGDTLLKLYVKSEKINKKLEELWYESRRLYPQVVRNNKNTKSN